MKDIRLFTLPCRLGNSKPFDTLANLGSYVNLIPLYLFNMLNIRLLEETENVLGLADGTKSYPVDQRAFVLMVPQVKEIGLGHVDTPYWTTLAKRKSYESQPSTNYIGARPPYYLEKDFMNDHLPKELEIARDAKLKPFKDVLVFRLMVEFLGAIPINLKGNIWKSEDLIDKKIDLKRLPKDGDGA
ncbi:hypothetical protein Tco_1106412 [Tanacetum coccineum]